MSLKNDPILKNSVEDYSAEEESLPESGVENALAVAQFSVARTKVIKNWKPKHTQIVALHCAGISKRVIAASCSCSAQLVSSVLKDDRAQQIISDHRTDVKRRLAALTDRAVQVHADAMNAKGSSWSDKLSAAKTVLHADRLLDPDKKSELSAEDIVGKILNVNVQINNEVS